jgi:hypothetical protein
MRSCGRLEELLRASGFSNSRPHPVETILRSVSHAGFDMAPLPGVGNHVRGPQLGGRRGIAFLLVRGGGVLRKRRARLGRECLTNGVRERRAYRVRGLRTHRVRAPGGRQGNSECKRGTGGETQHRRPPESEVHRQTRGGIRGRPLIRSKNPIPGHALLAAARVFGLLRWVTSHSLWIAWFRA